MTNPPIPDPLVQALATQYHVVREVGRGGMGVVYLAHDLKLDRDVAIKTLPPALSDDPVIRARFLREARTAAGLSHPNIVPIHRADEVDGRVFFVMGYVDGAPLSALVRDGGPMSPRTVVAILHDVASALAYAHHAGVVHRDVKAENILIERATGRAMVTDFGIARVAEAAPLTATGTVLGTVYYMSPEQVAGDSVDPRSDIYSLGVVAFFALSGRFPFEHVSASAVLVSHVTKAAPFLSDVAPSVPDVLARLVDRCLQKDPAARYQSCEELIDALEDVEQSLPAEDVPAPPPGTPSVISQTEAQHVWRRAAELQDMTGAMPPLRLDPEQARNRRPVTKTEGFNLEQVRDAAREAGIGEKFVQRAIAERGLGDSSEDGAITVRDLISQKPNPLLGRPASISFEAIVPGEVPDRDFDVLLDTIRRRLGEPGVVSAVGRSLNWSSSDRQRRIQVTVLVREGRTSILVSERMRELVGGLFGGIMGGGSGITIGPSIGLAINAFHSPALVAPFILAATSITFFTARQIFNRIARKRYETLKDLTTQLADEVRLSVARRTLGSQQRYDRRLPR